MGLFAPVFAAILGAAVALFLGFLLFLIGYALWEHVRLAVEASLLTPPEKETK